jgi:hypothetical protein
MSKYRSPRQQNIKKNKEAMQTLSKILSRRNNASPQIKTFKKLGTQENEFRRSASQIRSYTPKYQRIFYGHCFNFANFGHKAIKRWTYAKNWRNYAGYLNNSYPKKSYEAYNRNQNNFGSLSNELECYKWKKNGHIVKNCSLAIPPSESKKNINNRIS